MGSEIQYTKAHAENKQMGEDYSLYYNTSRYECLLDELENDFLARTIAGRKRSSLLDFACGTGRKLRFLEKHMKPCMGIDLSPSMIKQAKKNCSSRIHKIDILKEDIGKKFDVITAFRFFLNIDEEYRIKFLRRLASLLEQDGILAINYHRNPLSIMGILLRIKNLFTDNKLNYMSVRKAKELAEEAGMIVQDVSYQGFFPGRKNILVLPKKPLYFLERLISRSPLRYFCVNFILILKKE